MSISEYSGFSSKSLKDMILSVDEDYNVSAPVVHPDMKFAVANDSANNIKVTSNNLSEFEKNSSGELVIEGFGGNDKISGTSGNDYIDGGVGADVMSGGMGDDTYIVDDSKDKVVEASNGGVDTIITTLNKFSLAKMPNVENLTFDGIGDANLTPTTQGIPSSRDTMAAWQVLPPRSVMMAEARFIAGTKSGVVISATRTSPCMTWSMSFGSVMIRTGPCPTPGLAG